MEVTPAVRRHLMWDDTVKGYVQDRVYKAKLYTHVQNTGRRAVVVRTDGGWRQPDAVNTARFPLLVIDHWADCTRDSNGDKTGDDAIENAMAVWRATDPLLSRKRNTFWGAFGVDPGLYVIVAEPFAEPVVQTRDESHQGSFLGVKLGECAVVTVSYALTLGS